MKAISLWQPWASAIPAGLKLIETRPRLTHVRGRIAIHAAKRWTREQKDFWQLHVAESGHFVTRDYFRKVGVLTDTDLLRGFIIATADLYQCRPTERLTKVWSLSIFELEWGNFLPGRWGWMLNDILPVSPPVPCIGRQGWFNWNPP